MTHKGLVHPKIKILSVFTHPHDVVPNLYVFICSAEHKGRYLEECNEIGLIKTLFQISSFVFIRTNKHIEVWNNMTVSKY